MKLGMRAWKVTFVLGVMIAIIGMLLPNGAYARDSLSTRKGTSLYPLYWTAYENSFVNDAPISETRWKDNIDWVSSTLLPHGYNMVTTDGWIYGATQTNANGYLLKYNDAWSHDWAYWVNYASTKGLDMGVYYNPLWIEGNAAADPNKKVVGTNIALSSIASSGWVDVTKTGAKEYIQGYVNYFKNMGIRFLRIDFLSWYESGAAAGAPVGSPSFGTTNYATALQWMHEAAGDNMELSLVMPNSFNHASNELKYGDLMRIDTDTANGGWTWLNRGSFGDERQTWNSGFSQWANPFQGFTAFADIAGRGGLTLDGDFLRFSTFSGTYADNEKRSVVSLFTMAGSPLAAADQYDTIGTNLSYYTNKEILALKKEGFVGKPVFNNGNPFEPSVSGQPDTGSRDSERWLGQTANGDWIVALFNRSDSAVTKSIDFASSLGLASGGQVRDIWNHTDLGSKTSHSVTLNPHDVSMIRIRPNASSLFTNRYEAEVGTYRGGAHFNNDHTSRSGMGFVDQFSGSYPGANVVIGVQAEQTGTYTMGIRYANATGSASTGSFKVTDINNTQISTGTFSLPTLTNWDTWGTVNKTVTLNKGLNLITMTRGSSDTGAFNLDYLELNNRNPVINGGFESGSDWKWIEWHPTGQVASYGVDGSDVNSGTQKMYFYNGTSAYQQSVHQLISVPNGTYTVRAAVKLQSSTTPTTARMELSNYGGSQLNVNISVNSSYQTISQTVTVSNGQLDIGFYLNAPVNASLQMDDIVLVP
ncbi:CBM35 domain-containing protein [Paenibacillus qinlingensis]|uniref:CBM35 domain-containing protein n=1 Tax=Paenibacillus qinlingensis TaxID=1837343 RepID=UPI00156721E5|nr:CBM35 domain-containing protein [Paenibacillus qinlingensis]NQX58690.1 carbohydrate-binding protein [Paenibacillus qinlingensis]